MLGCGAQPCSGADGCSGCRQGSATRANGGQSSGTAAGGWESLALPHRHTERAPPAHSTHGTHPTAPTPTQGSTHPSVSWKLTLTFFADPRSSGREARGQGVRGGGWSRDTGHTKEVMVAAPGFPSHQGWDSLQLHRCCVRLPEPAGRTLRVGVPAEGGRAWGPLLAPGSAHSPLVFLGFPPGSRTAPAQHVPLHPQPPQHCPPHASGKLNRARAIQLAARGRMEPDLHKIYPKNATQAFQ